MAQKKRTEKKFSKLDDFKDGDTIYFLMNGKLHAGDIVESFYTKGKKIRFLSVQYLSEGTKSWKRPSNQKLLKRSKPLYGREVFGKTPEEVWEKITYDYCDRA